jgi:hypothetical protein
MDSHFHHGLVRSSSDLIQIGSSPQQKFEGIHKDRLSSSRFTGKDIQTRCEAKVQMINYREILNSKLLQHSLYSANDLRSQTYLSPPVL